MTFEIITTIILMCQIHINTENMDTIIRVQKMQEQCHVWYVDCLYEEAGRFGVETGSKQISAVHMRKCMQRRGVMK